MRTNTVYPWQVAKHLAISIKHSLGDSDWTSGKPFSLGGVMSPETACQGRPLSLWSQRFSEFI